MVFILVSAEKIENCSRWTTGHRVEFLVELSFVFVIEFFDLGPALLLGGLDCLEGSFEGLLRSIV